MFMLLPVSVSRSLSVCLALFPCVSLSLSLIPVMSHCSVSSTCSHALFSVFHPCPPQSVVGLHACFTMSYYQAHELVSVSWCLYYFLFCFDTPRLMLTPVSMCPYLGPPLSATQSTATDHE